VSSRERRGHNPADGAAVCSAALQAMSLMALRVLLSKQRAVMPMGGSGSKAGAVGVCGVAGNTASTAVP